jgi:hypothetical protein
VSRPPRIDNVSTYQEGALVYVSVSFSDPDSDADGFGFRGANGAGWAEETHPFSAPSYGRVAPGRFDYPFNHGCGTPDQQSSDVEFWIYDRSGNRSGSTVVRLACSTGVG